MKNKIKVIRIILFFLIIIWAILVFCMSNQVGEESSGVSSKITSIFFSAEELIKKIEPIIRKIAHLSEYALGGALFISLFLTYEWENKKRILISIGLGCWYAIFDEIHQLFVPGRSGNIVDVAIDTIGVCIGVMFVMSIYKFLKNKRKKVEE